MNRLRPKSRLAPVLIVVGFVFASLLIYALSYVALATDLTDPVSGTIERAYSAKWQTTVFVPAAFIEAKVKGMSVLLSVGWEDADAFNVEDGWRLDP